MANKRDFTAMVNSIMAQPVDDRPIKKTGLTTVGKSHIENGTAIFNNTKNVNITFAENFTKVPLVQLTLSSTGSAPAFKNTVTNNWMIIKFQSNWTGEVDREARERP